MRGGGTFAWPNAEQIVAEFWRRSGRPSQRQLDTLIDNMAIPVMALAGNVDGDFPIGMFRVERDRGTFSFTDDEAIKPVVGFVAWDQSGEAHDLIAWSPKDDWTGSWLGKASALNEFEIHSPRINDQLRVFLHVADWLRHSREGLCVIDKVRSAHLLEGRTVQALDLEEGAILRKLLERPRAKVVVPARCEHQAAA